MSMRDKARKRAEARRTLGGLDTLELPEGIDLYKPEKGTIEFDVLPYKVSVDSHPEVKKGELWYERTYFVHPAIGPEEKYITCPKSIGKACPICEEYHRLKRDPDADEEVVAGLRPKERELFNIVLSKGDGTVMILDMSTFLFGRKLEEEIREGDESNAGFAELKDGKTLKVRWETKSMGKVSFLEAGRIDFLDREDFSEEALDIVVDLDKCLKVLSYDEISAILQGAPVENEEEPEEEKVPSKRKISRGKKSIPVEEEEQLPGLEEEEAEEEEAEEEEAEEEDCIACDGTGKTTKGKVCPICEGSGKSGKPASGEEEPEEPEEEEPEEPEEEEPEEPEEEETTLPKKNNKKLLKRTVSNKTETKKSTGRRIIKR